MDISGNAPKRANESTFAWQGKDATGKAVRGEMRAAGAATVGVLLRRQGILVTRVRRRGSAKRITDKDIALFTRQLATMMTAGVPLLQSFDIVAKGHAKAALKAMVTALRADIETGTSLHQAFRKFPLCFDTLFCDLVGAGEQAGKLDELLTRLAVHKEKTLAMRARIAAALTYPVAILAVALAVTGVIMVWVVPAFREVFTSFGAELPAPTLFVMALSAFFIAWWHVIVLAVGAGAYLFVRARRRSPPLRRRMDRLALRLPVFGTVLRKAAIARWTRTLATMFAAGVPLADSLDAVGGAAGNAVYLDASRAIGNDIGAGASLAAAMRDADVFDDMVTQLVAVGEESGSLDAMLSRVADLYEEEVDAAVASLSSLMEPAIMVVLGVLIGGLVVAMYLPIFRLGAVM